MNTDPNEKRKAYEAAKAHQRAYYERFHPVRVLGGRPAEAETPETTAELTRLSAATEAARIAWNESRHR